MILYIPLEVYIRELRGHLLLAISAVSKGNQVLIASPNDIWLYKRLSILPKGSYLIKNMNIPTQSRDQYQKFLDDDFDLYCQEQEPSTLFKNFEDFLKLLKIKSDQMLPFKGVFCWGKRDTNGYKNFFKSNDDIFYNTGSPRVDLWNKKYLPLRQVNYVKKLKPYILFVSNFGILMGKNHWIDHIKNLLHLQLIKNDNDLESFIQNFQEDNYVGYEMVLAIKRISNKFPDLNIVIRPHPTEKTKYWKTLFNNEKNIIIASNTDPLTSWISHASIVIHNGCTSAIETIIQKIPLISHGPDRKHSKVYIPNSLGIRTKNIMELEKAITDIVSTNSIGNSQYESENKLKDIISYDNCDSANQIIDIINEKSNFGTEIKITYFDIIKMRIVRSFKNLTDNTRRLFGNNNLVDVDYKINRRDVKSDVKILSKILNVPPPKIKFISKTGIFLER